MSDSEPSDEDEDEDLIGRRLSTLADALESCLGDSVRVEREVFGAVHLVPARPDALAVSWFDFGADLQVETLAEEGHGGRFELARTVEDVDFLEAVVRSVVAGRVVQVFAPERSRVTITMPDGRAVHETGYSGLSGCIPLPGWRFWGRRVRYAPY